MPLTSRIPTIIVRASAGGVLAVRKAEASIERRAKAHSRVRSGEMRGGWQHQPTDATSGMVFNLVDYTIYNEFGTYKMSAQPMARPAVEETRDEFEADLRAGYS